MSTDHAGDVAHTQSFTLGEWNVDPKACLVSRGDTVIKLRPQLVDVLVCLARRAGKIVLKDELLKDVWPGQFIAESGLSRCVAELRQILQDDAQQPRYIETVMKRGYRLVAPVAWLPAANDAAARSGNREAPDAVPAEAAGAQPREAGVPAATRPSKALRRIMLGIAVIAGAVVIGGGIVLWLARTRQPVLTDQDSIVLCFENHSGETLFNGALQLALAVQLEQSPFLRVVSDEHVRQTLRLMGKPADTPFVRALAAEVCEREGARVMVVGSLARLGSRYAIGLEAVACRTGDVLARQQLQVKGREDVLEGLGETAKRMRQALGESIASVERYAVPIARATTPSLEALRTVSLGDLEWRRGHAEAAVARYREAIALDPSFALAYARLSSPLSLLAHARQLEEAVTRAYELRDRTSLPERLEIEARYNLDVADDYPKAIEALEALKRFYPRSTLARRGLAQALALVGRYEDALVEALEAVRLEPDGGPEHTVLAQAYIHLNRFDDARRIATAAVAKKIDGPVVHAVLFDCAFAAGDRTAQQREIDWAAGDPDAEMLFLEFQAENAVYAGKLREARTTLQRAEAIARQRGDDDQVSRLRLTEALFEALYGRGAAAAALVDEVLPKQTSGRAKLSAALVLALTGAVDRAAALGKETEGATDLQGDSWRRARLMILALIEVGRGRPEAAVELLQPLAPQELGVEYDFLPVIVRGQAHLRAGNGGAATREFEKVLAHTGLDPSSEMIAVARLGLARGHAIAGNTEASRAAWDALLAQLRDADPDLPMLALARRERERLPKVGR